MPDKMSAEKIAVLRAYGAEVVVCPTAVAPEHPDSYYSVSRPARRARSPSGWNPNQYANPLNPAAHYAHDRPGGLEADRRAGHALRRRRRHRRHDQRHRPLPQGGVARVGPGHRRRPRGLGLLRRHRPAVPRRGRRRGLLAGDLRPHRRRPDHRRSATATRSSRPAASPARRGCSSAARAGWPSRRRCALAEELDRGRRRRRAAARLRPRLPVEDLQRRVDGRLRLPRRPTARSRPSATCCSRKGSSRRCPSSCTCTREETVGSAIAILREYGV